jgi:hypothetical protein
MTVPIAMTSATLWFIVLPIAVAWIVGVVDILRHGLPVGQRVLWIVIVIVFPIVGTLVYFFLRKPTDREIRAAQARAADHSGR